METLPAAKSARVLSGILYNRNSSVCAADARATGLLCLPLHTYTAVSVIAVGFDITILAEILMTDCAGKMRLAMHLPSTRPAWCLCS